MSLKALTWAFDTQIESSSCKFVLVALADYANDEGECYPSIETMVRKTALNRKTIISCLDKLVLDGFLSDSGERKGKTQQVKVYRIMKESQNRNSSVFTRKESQKRDTEPSEESSSKYKEEEEVLKKRIQLWFNRRDNTQFDSAETKALKSAAKLKIPSCDLDLLDWWFSLPADECFQKYGNGRKKNPASLLNAIQGEIVKARSAKGTSKPSPQILVNEKLDPTEYLQWLDSHDWGDRMKPWWRNLETAPHSLISDFLEFKKQAI